MKILHTADWHLGQKFSNMDRLEEHQLVLNWLLEYIVTDQIQALIVAGDIFDVNNPPNYARTLYYQFLTKLSKTSCKHIIIVGGNHDSPSMLEASKDLLKLLDIHVVGCATEKIEDEVLILRDEKGVVEAYVAAVPYLREKDIRKSIAGESSLERTNRTKEGIVNHFKAVAEIIAQYDTSNVPVIATGHLFATGGINEEGKRKDLYVGNIENIDAEQFPTIFDYVALGHLHRPQKVGGKKHIQYSGSIIPLSFSEIKDNKVVKVLHFKGKNLEDIESVQLPLFRRLIRIEGNIDKIKKQLIIIKKQHKENLEAWVEIIIEGETEPNIHQVLEELTIGSPIHIFRVRLKKEHQSIEQLTNVEILSDLDVLDVFRKKCEREGEFSDKAIQALEESFLELRQWINEEDIVL